MPNLDTPSRRAPRRLGAALAAALLPALCPTTSAAADGGEVARFLAVGGAVSSWAYALWNGASLTDCPDARWQFRAQAGRDGELDVASVGAAYGECRLLERGSWSLTHQPSVMVSHWQTRGTVTGATSAQDIAFVPLVHWSRPLNAGMKFEVEVGVGPTWLSEAHIGNRLKSTEFQFSDSVGVGLADAAGRWRVGLTWRHISNSDIQTPNQAVDLKMPTVAFRL